MPYLKFLFVIILTLLTSLSKAQDTTSNESKGIDITININNIRGNNGKVYFGLYDSAEKFANHIAFQELAGTIKEGKTSVVFHDILPGTYAVKCFHDANNNKQIDFDGYMPTEDYGSTNNPREYGPPTFSASKFEVTNENLNFEIIF